MLACRSDILSDLVSGTFFRTLLPVASPIAPPAVLFFRARGGARRRASLAMNWCGEIDADFAENE
eukprot:7329416-Alexandrium_andersonii.AAC.1